MAVTLSVFYQITALITGTIASEFLSLDNAIVISSPPVSILDFFLIYIVVEELWGFVDFLRDT